MQLEIKSSTHTMRQPLGMWMGLRTGQRFIIPVPETWGLTNHMTTERGRERGRVRQRSREKERERVRWTLSRAVGRRNWNPVINTRRP